MAGLSDGSHRAAKSCCGRERKTLRLGTMEWIRANVSARVWFATLFVWLATGNAALVHEYTVTHVWCAEHGEVVEQESRGVTASSSKETTASAGSKDGDHHDHGCGLPGGPPHTDDLPIVLNPPTVTFAPWPTVAAVTCRAPRPPPLAYAPKTSPPATV